MQHITAWTSDPEPLIGSEGWQRNGAGLRFNLRFGFGLMNAGRFVETAAGWTTVPAKHICIEELAIKYTLARVTRRFSERVAQISAQFLSQE